MFGPLLSDIVHCVPAANPGVAPGAVEDGHADGEKVEREKRPGRYRDGHIRGLDLQIGPTGGKSWLLRFERDGRERWLGLGPLSVVDLRTARERARAARLLLLDGIDPIDHRKAEKAKLAAAKAKLLTFREATQQYFDQHERKWKNAKHRTQFTNTLKQYAFPVLGDMAVADIGTPEVLRAIEPHWHTKTETMSRVRGRIEVGARLGGACAAIARATIRRAGQAI